MGQSLRGPGVPHRTDGWRIEPFADLSAAFVFFTSPLRIAVLDRLTWYVLELCDGRTVGAIVEKVRSLGGAAMGARAEDIVDERLCVLRDRGLLEGVA